MKKPLLLISLMRLLGFWILFFLLNRIVFYVSNSNLISSDIFKDVFKSFVFAFPLDLSTSSYLLAIPLIILILYHLSQKQIFLKLISFYHYFFIFIIASICSSEIGVFKEWGVKLNYKALSYIERPLEIFQSASNSAIITSFLLIIFQTFIGIISFRYIFNKNTEKKSSTIYIVLQFLFVAPLLFIAIRGGINPIPISQSSVYFSKNNFVNTATVNSSWNVISSISKNFKYLDKNPYLFYTNKEVVNNVQNLFTVSKDSTTYIINTKKPNIVLILLESWTADLIQQLDGIEGVTPFFNELINDGLLFTNCYASGERSDQAVAAVFSAFPAQPATSIIKNTDKYQKLPCIANNLKQHGYSTSFFFGGELNYGNIKGYIYYNGFDKIIEEKDFKSELKRGRLGVHDEFLFDTLLFELNKQKQPFFASTFTLSSHSPYDQPMKDVILGGGDEKGFLNSAYYTDRSLRNFLTKARKQSWYKNTLFVFVADHSHVTPRHWDYHDMNYRRIPLLFYGDVIKPEFRGTKVKRIASQVDIATTLLKQIDLPSVDFKWSRNLFNSNRKDYVFCAATNGFCWYYDTNYYAYDFILNESVVTNPPRTIPKEQDIKNGKSYLQLLFDEYLKK